ncbi:MAG TPA: lipid A biosynthesis lauroyl acyltransferase [Azospirillum sp.]|nr:lipid A biosynthesis lauroyl acyltransferase [Azospirillum sp.]
MGKLRSPLGKWLKRRIGYPLEAVVVHAAYRLFQALPVDTASSLGGWIGRAVGPRLRKTKVARRNLARAFPEKSAAEIERIIRDMWDNLGRIIAEYPHLDALSDTDPGGRTELVGSQYLDSLRDDGIGGIMVGGHLGNWEVAQIASRKLGLDVAMVYRAPNNPYVGRLLAKVRGTASGTYFPKGADGARMLIRHLSKGGHVGMLIDQKMNDGIAVPFFGRSAMTAPAAAQLSRRLNIPIFPQRTERLEGARFRITILPPIEPSDTGNTEQDTVELLKRLNVLLEGWIRERPGQWLWLHRRWPD